MLTLSADDAWILKWFVDAACGVHADMKGHTGGALTLGKGAPIGMSAKQKLNAMSSTECKLVGSNDVPPAIVWTNHFSEA